ncbi:MAG: hypothetical protein Hens3KO_18780 [Henriciella sp.]
MAYKSRYNDFDAGDMVAVRFGGVLWHYGIVTSSGTVISNSRLQGGVIEQSLSAFAKGRRVRLCGQADTLDAVNIERRARRALGSEYRLTSSNCIDLTRRAHRQSATPWQVTTAIASAIGDALSKSNRRY